MTDASFGFGGERKLSIGDDPSFQTRLLVSANKVATAISLQDARWWIISVIQYDNGVEQWDGRFRPGWLLVKMGVQFSLKCLCHSICQDGACYRDGLPPLMGADLRASQASLSNANVSAADEALSRQEKQKYRQEHNNSSFQWKGKKIA